MESNNESSKPVSLVYPVFISLIAALGGLLFAFDAAIISGVVPFLQTQFQLSGGQIGWIVSSLVLGCTVGVILSGAPADKYGRVKPLMLSAFLFTVGVIGAAWTNSIALFVVFRSLAGFSVGISSMVSPMYIAEVAPAKNRGFLVSLYQLTIVVGILLGFVSNYFLVDIAAESSWRYMLSVMAIPSIIFFIGLFFVPESPRWLIINNQQAKALHILEKINGKVEAAKELKLTIDSLKKVTDSGYKAVFSKAMRKPLIIGIGLAVFQQITGINAIMYYAPTIFAKTGASVDSAIFQTILVGVINLIFTLFAMYFVDKVGRKPILIIGSSLMSLALLTVSASFFFNLNSSITLVAILVYIAAFASSLGPVTWVVISELFPNSIRGKAMSISIVSLWLACFVVALVFPLLLEKIGISNTFFGFTGICIISLIFNAIYVNETKGKELV